MSDLEIARFDELLALYKMGHLETGEQWAELCALEEKLKAVAK